MFIRLGDAHATKTHLNNSSSFVMFFQICEILEHVMWVMIRFQYASDSVISIKYCARVDILRNIVDFHLEGQVPSYFKMDLGCV